MCRRNPDDNLRHEGQGRDDETGGARLGPRRMSDVRIAADGAELQADLRVPQDPFGIVLFAHRSGTSRFSPRNRQVAAFLNQHRLDTLLLDLLTAEEENLGPVSEIHFDIGLLARRLTAASEPQGYFGVSTTAAALIGAATRAQHIRAVVSRGGRADLAGDALPAVRAPTLLIVGGEDPHVLALNRLALARMCCEHELARAWFLPFLVPAAEPA